ncbi:MAG: hypothetical protein MUE52_17955 [Tabrizicola sp.]|jgi:hypothetical protein|nr:hypothetical protein [Tabrizicola sp.]
MRKVISAGLAVAIGFVAGLSGLVPLAQAQSGPVDSPFLAEFLDRFVDPVRRGEAIDLSGLSKMDTVFEATRYAASDGSIGATIVEAGGEVEIMSIASVDENLAPVPQGDRADVRMTRAELDGFVAAVKQWQSATEGVTPVKRCPDWPVPGASENVLLQEVVTFQGADGKPAFLQVTASNVISAEAAETLKPVWFVVMVLQTGKEWRCPA